MLDYIIKNIYLFSAAAMLSIGHFYDDRLVIYNINITLIISSFLQPNKSIMSSVTSSTFAEGRSTLFKTGIKLSNFKYPLPLKKEFCYQNT